MNDNYPSIDRWQGAMEAFTVLNTGVYRRNGDLVLLFNDFDLWIWFCMCGLVVAND